MRKLSYPPPEWRYADLLESLKPYSYLIKRLEAEGYPRIPRPTLSGWRRRNFIPGCWVPVFIKFALESRVIDSIDDLRVPPKPPTRKKTANAETAQSHQGPSEAA